MKTVLDFLSCFEKDSLSWKNFKCLFTDFVGLAFVIFDLFLNTEEQF